MLAGKVGRWETGEGGEGGGEEGYNGKKGCKLEIEEEEEGYFGKEGEGEGGWVGRREDEEARGKKG